MGNALARSGPVYDTRMRIAKLPGACGLVARVGTVLLFLAAGGVARAGQLSFLDAQVQGVGGVNGLDVALSIAVSPDGRHVYVAGYGDDAVSVFARDLGTGVPSFVEVQKDGVAGVDGLAGANSVAVSPDGKHVYVAGNGENAIAVFSRNATSGHLTFVEVDKNGVGGVSGLGSINALAVSPDGKHVYAAGFGDDAIAVFRRDAATGSLGFAEVDRNGELGIQGLGGASSVAVSPDGKHVYATGANDNAVAAFDRNPTTGSLSFVQAQFDGTAGVDGLAYAYSVAVSRDGKHVYVAGSQDNGVAVFSRNPNTGSLSFVQAQIDGMGGVDGLNDVQAVAVSPDGAYLYAAAYTGDGGIAVFRRSASTGALSFLESEKNGVGYADGIGVATAVAVSPDGQNVYATGTNLLGNGALAAFAPGVLSFVEVQRDGVGGVDGLGGAYSAAVSPDGKHVYAVGSTDNAVAVFSRDATTGSLSFVEAQKNGVAGVHGLTEASGVAVSPDGKHVYATGRRDSALAVFARNATTGALTFVEYQQDGIAGVDGLAGALAVAVSPDGKQVYATGYADAAVAVFSRNPATGSLDFVEVRKEFVAGVVGVGGPSLVAVSPDGKNVCVAGSSDSAVAVFSRDATTGSLGFVEAQIEGMAGVDGISSAYGLAFSPDGRYVYVSSPTQSTIALFSRAAATGSLGFLGTTKDGVGGVHGINDVWSVLVSPDGRYAYATGGLATLAVFRRDPATGALAFFQLEQNGLAGVEGLAGDFNLAVSPDGRHVYVPSASDSAIAVFAPEPERGLAAAAVSTLIWLARRRARLDRRRIDEGRPRSG